MRIKKIASPTSDIQKNIKRDEIVPERASDKDREEFEREFFKQQEHGHAQIINSTMPVDKNKDLTLDFASTNHEAYILLFTVPSGLTLYTSKLILACVDVVDVESLAYLNSISKFYVILGSKEYLKTTKTGQVLPYYTLTPFSYFNGNPIADFEMEIPQNTPVTIYGKYTDQFISDMISAGITDIQYHFNVRLLGKLVAVTGG